MSVYTGGGGYPSPRFFPRSFQGDTPVSGSFPGHWSQVLSGRGSHTPAPGHWPQVFSRGGTSVMAGRVPHSFLGVPQSWPGGIPVCGYPSPGKDWVHPSQVRMGTPYPGQDGVPSMTEKQNKHLLCTGWYASFVHAGGLSCSIKVYWVGNIITAHF